MVQDKTDPVGLCPYCGKQIKEESATIYIGGETCAVFCSAECMSLSFRKNLRRLTAMPKCVVCGKRKDSGRFIKPDERFPEIKKESFLCSQKCEDTFCRRIISARKKSLRKQLEHKTEKATDEDHSFIWNTLTPKEQKLLAMIGFGHVIAHSDHTPADFYKKLRLKMEESQ